MSHVFEHDGIQVEYYPATVRMRLNRSRVIGKLLEALHLSYAEPTPPGFHAPTEDEFDDIAQYAAVLTQSRAVGAAWWVSPGAAPEQLAAAYECYLDSDGSLFDLLRRANRAVAPEKKTGSSNPKTSSE